MAARSRKKSEFALLTNTPVGGVSQLHAQFVTHVYERHSHDTFCVGVTRAGVQAFRCHGAEQASLGGDIMALNPDEPHDGHAGTPDGYSYRMLYLAPTVIREWLSEAEGRDVPLQYFRQPVLSDHEVSLQLERAFEALNQPRETLRGQALLVAATLALFQRWAVPRRSEMPAIVPRWMNRVRDYLEAHYAEDITVEKLGAVGGVSRVHVTRAFERAYGLPPHRYLNAVRIRQAKRLLQEGLPTAAVAFEVGYADQSHFTRRFKGSVGVPPAAWRKTAGRERKESCQPDPASPFFPERKATA